MSTQTAAPTVPLLERIPILVILGLLVFLIFARTGESVHGQMTRLASLFWDNYFELRTEPKPPTCTLDDNIEARLDELEQKSAAEADDLLGSDFDREQARASLVNQRKLCEAEHAAVARYQEQVTPGIRLFRQMEHLFSQASIFATAQQQLFLVLLLFFASGVATWERHQIGFRPIMTELDHKVSTFAQLVANGALAISAWAFRDATFSSSIAVSEPLLINTMVAGTTVMALMSLWQQFNPPANLEKGGSLTHAFLSIPLYAIVMLIFASIVLFKQNHVAGLSIYFSAFFENAGTYLDVALYLWCGMLLKQTQLGERVFSLFTPWRLPPELLAFVAIAVIAFPTAYTGASAIIILAIGAVTYRELRKVGTRRQLALATTAMSGSSGIILKPCLMVIIVSILNKEVVSDDLFYWGNWVFLLTLTVFALYAMMVRKDPFQVARVSEALPISMSNGRALIPYVVTFIAVALAYDFFLEAHLDQFSAPIILPVIIFMVIVYERTLCKRVPLYDDPERMPGVASACTKAMTDASIHIGGLLMMMATFVIMMGLGGKAMSATFLADLGSPYLVMAAMIGMFIVIGMLMESMAAIGLVSLAIAPIAYSQGIEPVHFWMTCLVALELGLLSPPVALSHIFTRQVVGEEEAVAAAQEGDTFYYRHERILLPLMVMGTVLLIVGFGPLLLGHRA
jgi:TRAP-type C4-dicarboxylate transport system permease large subunit